MLQIQHAHSRKPSKSPLRDAYQEHKPKKYNDTKQIPDFTSQLIVGNKIKFSGKASSKFLLSEVRLQLNSNNNFALSKDDNKDSKGEPGFENVPLTSTHLPYLNPRYLETKPRVIESFK